MEKLEWLLFVLLFFSFLFDMLTQLTAKWICVHDEIYSDDIHRELNEMSSNGAPEELILFESDHPCFLHLECFHTHEWNWFQWANGVDDFGHRSRHYWMHGLGALGLAAPPATFCAGSMGRRWMGNAHSPVLWAHQTHGLPPKTTDNVWVIRQNWHLVRLMFSRACHHDPYGATRVS